MCFGNRTRHVFTYIHLFIGFTYYFMVQVPLCWHIIEDQWSGPDLSHGRIQIVFNGAGNIGQYMLISLFCLFEFRSQQIPFCLGGTDVFISLTRVAFLRCHDPTAICSIWFVNIKHPSHTGFRFPNTKTQLPNRKSQREKKARKVTITFLIWKNTKLIAIRDRFLDRPQIHANETPISRIIPYFVMLSFPEPL